MANKFQVKRTTVTSRTPNTTNSGNTHFIDTGELALNLTDGKMFSSNGTVYFEVGANLANQTVAGNANVGKLNVTASSGDEGGEIFLAAPANTTLAGGITIDAYQNKIRFFEQGGNARGAFIDLTACANGATTNLLTGGGGGSGTVTQVSTGDGLAGGPITTAGTISVIANNGIIANSTGLFANAGTGLVVNATGIHVNSSYIGTLSSNNASNLGGVAAASYVQNTDSRTLSGNLVISGTYFNPSANTILLGNSTQRWVISANTGNFSGAVNGITTLAAGNTTVTGFVNATSTIQGGSSLTIAGAASGITTLAAGNTTVTGFVNASTGFGSATINATSNGLIANSTTITVGNTSVNVTITTAGITSAGGTGVNPSSNTVGTALGTNTQRWVLNANTGSFAGAVSGITTLAAGNTTVTGFVNATSTIQGGSSLTIAGAASGITTLAAGNTTITGFANVSTSVNSAILSVGSNFIANTTQVTLAAGVLLSANGATGTAGHVLYSNGSTGSPYWAADGVASVTDDTTTNGNRYILFANQTSSTLSTSYVSSTKMYFNPSTGKLNATSFNSLSDFNKKENIQTLQDATSKVLKMRGVSFTWKGTNDKSIGLIAQEVEKILPEVVSTCEDGVKSISYDSIVGLLVEAFKEQQKTIDSLKDTINILSKNNNMDGDSK